MITYHVIVEANGAIRQQGHCHRSAVDKIRVADGCKLLAFKADPQVKARLHRYDFETSSFLAIGKLQ